MCANVRPWTLQGLIISAVTAAMSRVHADTHVCDQHLSSLSLSATSYICLDSAVQENKLVSELVDLGLVTSVCQEIMNFTEGDSYFCAGFPLGFCAKSQTVLDFMFPKTSARITVNNFTFYPAIGAL